MSTQEYVCGLLRLTGFRSDRRDRLLLLRKGKPDWQRGLLNGVGGKVETLSREMAESFHGVDEPLMENSEEAMKREWREESQLPSDVADTIWWLPFARLKFNSGAVVHFFKAESDQYNMLALDRKMNDAGERFEVHNFDAVLRRDDLIPNLKWLLPLAFLDVCDQMVLVNEVDRGVP